MFLPSIEYEIYLADGYGEQDENGKWNGLIGELGKSSNKKYGHFHDQIMFLTPILKKWSKPT